MKKLRNGRRGFTLLEMVIVIAIIVILSSAAVFGVATTLNRAQAGQAELKAHNGNNFEAAARNKVRSYGANSVDWSTIPKYTPENEALKQQKKLVEDEEWNEDELSLEYDTEGFHVIKEYNPDLHYGMASEDIFEAWKADKKSYLEMGYLLSEIEKGTTFADGSYVMKPVWEPSNHDGMTYEEYQEWLKNKDKKTTDDSNSAPAQTVGHVTAPVGSGGNKKPEVTKITGSGDTQTIWVTDSNGDNGNGSIAFELTKKGDNTYSCKITGGQYIFVGNLSGAGWNSNPFDLTDKDKEWLKTNYKITLD